MDGRQESQQSQPLPGAHRAITKTYTSSYISDTPQLQPLIDLLESKSSNDSLSSAFENVPPTQTGENGEIDYSTTGARYAAPYDDSMATAVASTSAAPAAVYGNPHSYSVEVRPNFC